MALNDKEQAFDLANFIMFIYSYAMARILESANSQQQYGQRYNGNDVTWNTDISIADTEIGNAVTTMALSWCGIYNKKALQLPRRAINTS